MDQATLHMIAQNGVDIIADTAAHTNEKNPDCGWFAFYKGGTTPPTISHAVHADGHGDLTADEIAFLNNEVANQQYFLMNIKEIKLSAGKICMVRRSIK